MNDIILSFIIPACNAEYVLRRSVESIVNGYQGCEIEVIIVENGSTDRTIRVAEELQTQYDMIRVFQSSKGVSAARNCGIRKAYGSFLSFVDADDFLPEFSVKAILEELKQEPDLLIGGYQKGNGRVETTLEREQARKDCDIEKLRAELIANPTKFMAVWAKAFSKDIIIDNEIFFNEELSLAEDGDFMIRYTRKCTNIVFSDKLLYHYNIDNESTVRSYDGAKLKKYLLALAETAIAIEDEASIIQNAYDKYILMHLNLAMVHETFVPLNQISYRQRVALLSDAVKEDVFCNAIRRTKMKECCSFRMLPILFLKWNMKCFAGLIYFLRAKQNYSYKIKKVERRRI